MRVTTGVSFIVLLAAVGFFVSRQPTSPPPEETPVEPTSVFSGVELVNQDADGTFWRLTAEEGMGREEETTGTLFQVQLDFRRASRAVRLRAGRAEIESGDEIRLYGNVEIQWGEYVAKVEQASYLRGKGWVRSEDPVVLTGPGLSVRGRGVEVDVEGKRARILSEVRTVIAGGGR